MALRSMRAMGFQYAKKRRAWHFECRDTLRLRAGNTSVGIMVGATSRQLFDQLHDAGVRYCLFKSNAHLAAALSGETDLDVLFDGAQIDLVHAILAGAGFKRFPTSPIRSYAGKEDFFGVDGESGRLLHLDIHYRLIVGASYFKNFRLPWEQRLLDTATLDPEHGVYVADPAHELLLLTARAALKLGPPQPVTRKRGTSRNMLDERDWLLKQVRLDDAVRLGREIFDEHTASLIEGAVSGGFERQSLRALRSALMPSLDGYRTYRPIVAEGVRRKRQLQYLLGAINRRYVHAPFGYSRGGTSGGLMVALVGSDGSGKSTLNSSLFSWLTSKLDVMPVYFGSGDGRVSLLRLPLWAIRQVQQRGRSDEARDPRTRMNRPVTWKLVVWSLILAREKHIKLDKATKARARGLIVICDRYPQIQQPGVNDGPLLFSWKDSASSIKRRIAAIEEKPYERASNIGPDVVIRLRATPEVAHSRKPGENLANLEFRADSVNNLEFPAARRVIEIDADQDADTVLMQVKAQLWTDL